MQSLKIMLQMCTYLLERYPQYMQGRGSSYRKTCILRPIYRKIYTYTYKCKYLQADRAIFGKIVFAKVSEVILFGYQNFRSSLHLFTFLIVCFYTYHVHQEFLFNKHLTTFLRFRTLVFIVLYSNQIVLVLIQRENKNKSKKKKKNKKKHPNICEVAILAY